MDSRRAIKTTRKKLTEEYLQCQRQRNKDDHIDQAENCMLECVGVLETVGVYV